ncbi:MAG: APC family permease [Acidobacteriota bacterium]|nr:APC family permease [Acidobacteriota bacterium]
MFDLKRAVVGRPIASYHADHHRFGLLGGLAVLSSDALSSVAYATEEILRVLMVGGVAALSLGQPVSLLIATLLVVVVFSYRKTIHAYPGGGGAYIVARDNLGPTFGLAAAAALLIDYTLTVAVSIAAGVSAIASALPSMHLNRVALSLGFIAMLMMGNLRGLRESTKLFGIPVYVFVGVMLSLIAAGGYQVLTGSAVPVEPVDPLPILGTGSITLFVLLSAFANGCTAMTGVEAVSDGVPAFKAPSAQTATRTLILMAVLAITMFVGISFLAHAYQVVPSETETVVSQLARGVFGGRNALYYIVQAATMLILVLAANTAFADFPRLASIVARDRYMPRQFMNLGDKLAFSNGIVALSVAAGVLCVVFGGDPHALIPLYMIGVFLSFTLSQTGMFLRARRIREPGWQVSAAISGVGAVVTFVVLLVVAMTKGLDGAWIVVVLIPLLSMLFRSTRSHYDAVARQLSLSGKTVDTTARGHMVIVPIGGVQRAVVEALGYASSLSNDVRAVYVNVYPDALEALKRDWPHWGSHVKLVVLQSPYRSMTEPLLDYIDRMRIEHPDDYMTVVLPEFVVKHWWHHLLHNQSALTLKAALLFRKRIVTTSVPFHLEE